MPANIALFKNLYKGNVNMINIGIVGYGNLGRGVEKTIKNSPDMKLSGVFTRREPSSIDCDSPVFHVNDMKNFKGKIDVMILCGGSKSDIMKQAPETSSMFNTVDSFDTHAKIPEYFDKIDTVCKKNSTVSIISTGWDPGLFSINRVMAQAILPVGQTYTFWGRGVSQGHSDAVRRINGVKNAVQYTIPNTHMIDEIKSGIYADYDNKKAHKREVFVVLEEGVDPKAVETAIKTMPDYFAGYDTAVHFIDEETMQKQHSKVPHGGEVIRLAETVKGNRSTYSFSLNLSSNPEFTASVNVAYARAAYRLAQKNDYGAKTVLDIPTGLLSPYDAEYLRKNMI